MAWAYRKLPLFCLEESYPICAHYCIVYVTSGMHRCGVRKVWVIGHWCNTWILIRYAIEMNPLNADFFFRQHELLFAFYIPGQRNVTGDIDLVPKTTSILPFYTICIMSADDMATTGAMSSADMILNQLSQNIVGPAPAEYMASLQEYPNFDKILFPYWSIRSYCC